MGVGHEVVDAGEVVGIEVVLELVGLDRVVELGKVVLGHNPIECLQLLQVLHLFLGVVTALGQPLVDHSRRALQPLQWVLNIDYQFLHFFRF